MNTANRIIVGLIGAAMIVVGATGFVVAVGWVTETTVNGVVPVIDAWDRWRGVEWGDSQLWLLLAGGLVVALVSLILIVRELAFSPRIGHRRVTIAETPRGRTTLRVSALERSIAADVARTAGVGKVSVEDLGLAPDAGGLRLRLEADPEGDVPSLGLGVLERSTTSLAQMLDRPRARGLATIDVRRRRTTPPRRVE